MMKRKMMTMLLLAGCATSAVSADAAAPATVTLKEGKMIEATFYKVRSGQRERLAEAYFPKAIELAKKYGLKPLCTFEVTKVDHGPAGAIAAWAFFEWPSVAAKERFEEDPDFVRLRKFRDSLLETLPKQVYLQVEETVSLQLDGDRLYEAAVAWANPSRAEHMNTYFAAAGPFIKERNVGFLGKFEVIGQPRDPRYAFDTMPNTFLLIDWGSEENKAAWFGSKTFQRVGWHRALALDRLFVIESRFNVPRG